MPRNDGVAATSLPLPGAPYAALVDVGEFGRAWRWVACGADAPVRQGGRDERASLSKETGHAEDV
ncbi:MAG: hypothetical protein EPO45_17380 [Sphingobium sp.]|nr:MAG: hypothetical protein EPO45_17380 [Sphingobium sp.]